MAPTVGIHAPSDSIRRHPLMSGAHSVGIVTAANPMFPTKTAGGMDQMAHDLHSMGLDFERTEGRYGVPEPSFIVHKPTRQQMFDLGHRYGQEAVIYSETGHPRHEMMYVNGPNVGRAHPSLPTFDVWHHEPPPDYYTHIPSAAAFLRLHFDHDRLDDTPLRSLVTAMPAYAPAQQPMQKSALELARSLAKSLGQPAHAHAYDWHDDHTDQHFVVRAHGGVLIRTKVLAKAEPTSPTSVGESTYAVHAAPFGQVGLQRDLRHYPLDGRLPGVQQLVQSHGFTTFYAGGRYGRPDAASRNYNTGHLQIAAPENEYQDAWRQTHELAHALTLPAINDLHGEGRRHGRLGKDLTLNNAHRAVHWEWMAAHKQRELLQGLGIHVPDEVFHQELNTLMHDAVHRVVTGKHVDSQAQGFAPHDHKVPLETSLGLVRDAAHSLGVSSNHDLLTKGGDATAIFLSAMKRSADVPQPPKTHTIPEVRVALAKAMKDRVEAFELEMLDLRRRELAKSDHTCLVCKQEPGLCKCAESMGKPTMKGELCDGCGAEKCTCVGVLPGKQTSKDATPDGYSHEPTKGKKLGKGDVPMAKPPGTSPMASTPKSKVQAPKVGGLAKAIPSLRPRLGGKDPASQMMTQHAAASAPMTAPEAAKPVPKLTPEQQSARHAEFTDFMPAGAFTPAGQGSAAAGAMKPGAAPAPVGVAHLAAPKSKIPGAPQGQGLMGGHIAALKGKTNGRPPIQKTAPSMNKATAIEYADNNTGGGGPSLPPSTGGSSSGGGSSGSWGGASTPPPPAASTTSPMSKTAPPGFSDELMSELLKKHGEQRGYLVAWLAHDQRELRKAEFLGCCALCKRPEHLGKCSR